MYNVKMHTEKCEWVESDILLYCIQHIQDRSVAHQLQYHLVCACCVCLCVCLYWLAEERTLLTPKEVHTSPVTPTMVPTAHRRLVCVCVFVRTLLTLTTSIHYSTVHWVQVSIIQRTYGRFLCKGINQLPVSISKYMYKEASIDKAKLCALKWICKQAHSLYSLTEYQTTTQLEVLWNNDRSYLWPLTKCELCNA